jgi:hypothetical protein
LEEDSNLRSYELPPTERQTLRGKQRHTERDKREREREEDEEMGEDDDQEKA